MLTTEVTICNKLGLHARAAAKLVSVANGYPATVTVDKAGQKVNGKSIMGVMMLAASKGTVLTLAAEGDGEADVIAALVDLIDNKFGEEE
jgi:phosphocarrier protein